MVHVEVDTSPISVENDYGDEGKCKVQVYLYDELIYESDWYKNYWETPDNDEVKAEWDGYFQRFQAEQFKEWLKTNGPGAQAEE